MWFLFLVFTILHLLANYCAVSVVSMETLNKSRLHLVVSSYLRTGKVSSVAWVNAKEPVVLRKMNLWGSHSARKSVFICFLQHLGQG